MVGKSYITAKAVVLMVDISKTNQIDQNKLGVILIRSMLKKSGNFVILWAALIIFMRFFVSCVGKYVPKRRIQQQTYRKFSLFTTVKKVTLCLTLAAIFVKCMEEFALNFNTKNGIKWSQVSEMLNVWFSRRP